MDNLESIIEAMPSEHQKDFTAYLQRLKSKQERKDIDLFRLLAEKQNLPDKEKSIPMYLYGKKPNLVAYHALRKRLMRQLADFILLKSREFDLSATASVSELLALARYLFDRGVEKTAWHMLRKAEKIAIRNDHFDLLNTIYHFQLEKSDSEFADPLESIIEKRNQNKPLCEEEERAVIAQALITKQLSQARQTGAVPDFESIISTILAQYQLTTVISKRPAMLYKLVNIARSVVLVRKDYYAFEPYVIQQYNATTFELRHGYIQLRMLYMIAQTLYRNRKFEESTVYLTQLYALLQDSQKSYWGQFYPKYVMLMAANYMYDTKRDAAIVLLEELLKNQGKSLSIKDQLNAQINLAFYYFQQEEYGKASRLLLTIPHSDQWCQKKMGMEWVLRKNLSELIIQYEFGNIDLVVNKIRSIETTFEALLKRSRNIRMYMQFVKELVEHPETFTDDVFHQKVEAAFVFLPVEQEDLQAMHFYAWLKAKWLKRKYYDVLLELVQSS
ncbi:hypothetical protein [Xanthocytophaga agilis]|uniref:Uncharacterized protein n=1 Tax=Xanthocytophaga agilis TaxID=3048010 RepID=A0AAE3R7X2_9BACT|nr:hypothetical protein [Xanthocytophaga agilis]MDJ1503202.1 hypothetical protein [Xanthocytophaga agilis]